MGGGGSNDDYSSKQAEIEAKKQKARDALNVMFGIAPTASASPQFDSEGQPIAMPDVSGQVAANKTGRDALYSTIRDNAFTAGKRGLDERKTGAGRDLKFELFAKGLNGGSVAVDQSALLDRTYKQGLLDLGAKADAAKTDVMGNDEQTRLGLLQSIDAGMDQGSALSSALNQMKVNGDRATASAQGTTLGNLFDDVGLLYSKSKYSQGQQNAQNWWGSNYPTAPRGLGGRGSSGIITSTGG